MGTRFNLEAIPEDVLRIAIPIRDARIAHVKDVPAGWNLGYWDNKFSAVRRIAVLEGTRLASFRYEGFESGVGDKADILKSMLCHGRIASLDLSGGTQNAGDMVRCCTTMWTSFLTRVFERKEDGLCIVAVKDAVSGKTRQMPIVVRRDMPNEHLLLGIDQLVSLLFNRQLERVEGTASPVRLVKAMLTRSIFAGLLIAKRVPSWAEKSRSAFAPNNPS